VVKEKEFSNMPQAAFDTAFDGPFPTYQPNPEHSPASIDAAIRIGAVFIPGFSGTYETLVDPSIAVAVMRR